MQPLALIIVSALAACVAVGGSALAIGATPTHSLIVGLVAAAKDVQAYLSRSPYVTKQE